MISVAEVAESLSGYRASLGDVYAMKDILMDALVSLGAHPLADTDFGGPRRKKVYCASDAAEQLVQRYIGGIAHLGDVIVIEEAMNRCLALVGRGTACM